MSVQKSFPKQLPEGRKILVVFLVVCMVFTAMPLGMGLQKVTADAYPQWNATTAYPTGSIVVHNRATWQAKWYNVNEEPMEVQGNAWTCIVPAPPIPPAVAEEPNGYDVPAVLYDDFNTYATSDDPALKDFGYEVSDRTGGPGPGGCTWSKNNVTFVADPGKSGNKFLRLTSTTNGQGNSTVQAEIMAPQQFLYGTYAARIKFADGPVYGPDGDQIVETFYTISPYTLANSTDYGEMDFEYLANGGWGKPTNTMWTTTWDTANDRVTQSSSKSFEGWHTCVIQCSSTEVKYYIDGYLFATHTGKYVPTTPMFLSFNQWFIDGVWAGGSDPRAYVEDIDWVYYAKDRLMVPAQAESNVNYYRNNAVPRKDTVKGSGNNKGPGAAVVTVDNPVNAGSYTVMVTVPAGNAATSMELYQGSTKVLTKPVTPNSSTAQTFTYPVASKPNGIYSYRADLSNSSGTTQSTTTTVQVTSSNNTLIPAAVSVDNPNNTGSYTVTVTVPAGNTATGVKLYETAGGSTATVLSNATIPNASSAQTFTYTAANKAAGTYSYRADVADSGGNTAQSSTLTVTVNAGPTLKPANIAVDNPVNTGSYKVTVTVSAGNTATRVKLYETTGSSTLAVLDNAITPNAASAQTFIYTAANKTVGTYSYRAEVADAGGAVAQSNTVIVTVTSSSNSSNVAAGKSITSSVGPIANGAVVTDGDKTTYNLAGAGEGLQWIQVDLGQSYLINKINQWHYFGDGRTYHDVIVRVSNDPGFTSGVTTVFNNDTDNSAGLGTGTDAEYAESSSGKTVVFNALNARYVRLYVNGSTMNPYNHFVEVEVWSAGS